MRMRGEKFLRWSLFFSLLLFSLATSSCVKVPMVDFDKMMAVTPGENLKGPWQYRWGDSPLSEGIFSWTQSSFDDPAWHEMSFPAASPPGRKDEQNVWMRTRLPSKIVAGSHLHILAFDQAAQVFVAGKKIYDFGSIDNHGQGTFLGYAWHLIPLAPEDAGQVISFRVWSSHINIGIVGNVQIGDKGSFIQQTLLDSFQGSLICTIFMVLGLASIAVFFSKRTQWEYFYFPVYTIAGIWLFTRTPVKFIILPNPRFWITVEVITLVLSTTGFVGFVNAIFQTSWFGMLRKLVWIGFSISALMILQAFLNFQGIMKLLLPAQIYLLFSAAFILAELTRHLRKHELEARLLAAGVAIFLVLAFLETLIALGIIFPSAMGKAQLTPWGLLGFAISMTAILIVRLVGVYRRIGRLKGQLEHILVGTKEMAVAREKIDAAKCALKYILAYLSFPAELNVHLILRQSKGSEIIFASSVILENSKLVEQTELITVAAHRHTSLESALSRPEISHAGDNRLLVPILWGHEPIGLLDFDRHAADGFGEEEKNFVSTLVQSLALSLANIDFLAETREKAALDAELDAARAVQESLLPPSTTVPGLRIASTYRSANQTGGDWIGYYYDSANHCIDFFIGDVTGHGFGASLLTGVVCGGVYCAENTLSAVTRATGIAQKSGDRLQYIANVVNNVVLQTGRNKLMMTMGVVSLDLQTGRCTAISAGHRPPYFIDHLEKKVKAIPLAGNQLGSVEKPKFGMKEFQLNPGDSIVLYTDGLFENTGPDEKATYSDRNFKQDLLSSENIQEAHNTVFDAANSIWQGHPPADDITFLGIQWLAPVERSSDLMETNLPGVKPLNWIQDSTPAPAFVNHENIRDDKSQK